MNKVISFSLWGDNPKYTVGAIRNAELAPIIYPNWTCWFYVGNNVPQDILQELEKHNHCKILKKNDQCDWTSMFWRFEAGYADDADVCIFRDTDSRLSMREKYAVDEWLNSSKNVHIMRDHPFHNFPILGGMWGIKKDGKYDIKSMLNRFDKKDNYGIDYDFLANSIYKDSLARDDQLVHDEFFEHKPFPSTRSAGKEFVGDVFDEYDHRDPTFYKYL